MCTHFLMMQQQLHIPMNHTRWVGPCRILGKFKPLVQHAWTFLSAYGFINFGVAPKLMREPERSSMHARTQKSIVIIGAGLAGAAAARQLVKWGYKVVLLEGRNRPGEEQAGAPVLWAAAPAAPWEWLLHVA